MKRRSLLLGGGSLLASLAAPVASASASGGRVVRFGQSAALTGPQAVYGKDVQMGIAAAFAAANANEASTGLRFELQTLDDGGVRTKCMSNALQLLDSGATALIGFTNGVAAEACMPMLDDTHAAMLGTASGNMGLRTQSAAGVFNVRAGYDAEFARIVNYVRDAGMQRLALVRLNDTSQANRDAMSAALASAGIKPRIAIDIDRHATDFTAVSNDLLAAKPDFVLLVANAGPAAAIISQLTQARYPGLFYASSYAGQDLLDTLTTRHQSCVMSVVVPRPVRDGRQRRRGLPARSRACCRTATASASRGWRATSPAAPRSRPRCSPRAPAAPGAAACASRWPACAATWAATRSTSPAAARRARTTST